MSPTTLGDRFVVSAAGRQFVFAYAPAPNVSAIAANEIMIERQFTWGVPVYAEMYLDVVYSSNVYLVGDARSGLSLALSAPVLTVLDSNRNLVSNVSIATSSGCTYAVDGPPIDPPEPLCSDTDGNGDKDNDDDGLCDNWEVHGIDMNNDGTVDLSLTSYDINGNGTVEPDEKADLNVKDIYIELDYMELHRPLDAAVRDVKNAFAARGIRLHVQVDEQAIEHQNEIAFPFCTFTGPVGTPEFQFIKKFGTTAERAGDLTGVGRIAAKKMAFRYGLFAHNLVGTGASGCAEIWGNDFVVSLGNFDPVGGHKTGNRDQQAATFMHELGHTLAACV